MNAPLTLPHGLTAAALSGEDPLRLLAFRKHGEPFPNQAEIAKAAGRAPKNIGRDLSQLQTAGLISPPGPDYGEWSNTVLTDAGWDALDALDRAAGQGFDGLIHVPPSQLDDNPLNPRKVYDPAALEAFADTVEADGGIITPLSVSPLQPNGRRFIWAGHRRKRGALIVEARFAARGEDLPAGLAAGVPCVERDASPTEALFIAVVENGQRENLTPWEEAQALAALATETGWSGRELARKTGLAPGLDQGDEKGVRDVQEKIKVARTAPADLVEAHLSGALTWEQFRNALRTGRMGEAGSTADSSVFPSEAGELRREDPEPAPSRAPRGEPDKPAIELNANQRLVLLEICHAARFHPHRLVVGEGADQVAYAPTGKYWLDLTASTLQTLRLVDFKHHGRPYIRVSPAGLAWMVENIAEELEPALAAARAEAEPGVDWNSPGYMTDWLNPQPPTPAEAAPPQTTTETDQADLEDAVGAQLFADVQAFVGQLAMGQGSPTDHDAWAALLGRTGTAGPFKVDARSQGCVIDAAEEVAVVVDVDNHLSDDFAQARALLIAAALNRACGFDLTEAA